MATKKQKREAALAKREKFLEEVRVAGLEAQRLSRAEDERRGVLMQAEADRINQRWANILTSNGLVR